MTTEKSDKIFAVISVVLLSSLVLGNLFLNFNIIDLIYMIVLNIYIIRYFKIKK